jgi:riboflavin kinase/FMN adenylyltransferase
MKVFHTISELAEIELPIHLAIGVFDGLHRGHQTVIQQALNAASENGEAAAVVTFDPHPVRVLSPSNAPRLITSTRHKLRLFEALGIENTLVIPFDRTFSQTDPAEFVRQLHASCQKLTQISVGHDWRFGRSCAGDVPLLEKLGAELGFRVTGVPTVEIDGMKASSTRIREAVAAGDFAIAEQMLNRPYTVLGTVIEGRHLGRELGFPTANLTVHNEQLPPTGVYAVRADWRGQLWGGVGNLGYRPSVEGAKVRRLLEVHLFDLKEEIYGEDIEIQFLKFLRPEKKFDSLDDLKSQIDQDARQARQILAGGS